MAVYEFFCRTCNTKFEKLLPMSAADDPVACPDGHEGALRTLSLVAAPARGDSDFLAGGGCACGGACSCGAR